MCIIKVNIFYVAPNLETENMLHLQHITRVWVNILHLQCITRVWVNMLHLQCITRVWVNILHLQHITRVWVNILHLQHITRVWVNIFHLQHITRVWVNIFHLQHITRVWVNLDDFADHEPHEALDPVMLGHHLLNSTVNTKYAIFLLLICYYWNMWITYLALPVQLDGLGTAVNYKWDLSFGKLVTL